MRISRHSITSHIYTAECVEFAGAARDSFRWSRVRVGIITDYPPSCRYPVISFTAGTYRGTFCFFRLAIAWDAFRTPRILIWLSDKLDNLNFDAGR